MNRGSVLARKQRQKKIRRLSAIILIIVIVGSFLLLKALSSPAKGSVRPVSYNSAFGQQAAGPASSVSVTGNYIRFSYKDNYRSVAGDKPTPPRLEAFDFVTRHAPFRELAIGISQLPSGNLSDDGSYNMRRLSPEKYALEHWSINGNYVPVFASLDEPYAKAAFITHNGMLLTVALSGQGDNTQMQTEEIDVIKSVEWLR